MRLVKHAPRRPRVNRRAFLRGTAGVTLGLPFLESLPERSAWAADAAPIFSLFVCATEGVVPARFFPDDIGALTSNGLALTGKATAELADHAPNLLFLNSINWVDNPRSEPHAEGFCLALTAMPIEGTGAQAMASGPSADQVIASIVHPGTPPLTLYAGNRKNGYIAERLSFDSPGHVVAAEDNPYTLYQQLIGVVGPGGATTPGGDQAMELLLRSRNSINDLVREDLSALMSDSRMSLADRQRLQQHFDAIRDAEITMDTMGNDALAHCTSEGLDVTKLEAFENFLYRSDGMVEDMLKLHMSLVALAFACNQRRTATLQWGDGVDHTIYDVPSNELLGWPFSYISHRIQSDGQVGTNDVAEQAHAEIDVLRMQSLAAGLDHFKARGLEDQCFVLWTIDYADGPSHSFRNVPHMIWGNAGGYLKQAEYLDVGARTNQTLLNTLITAAVQDTGMVVEDFGEGSGGQLDAIRA